MMLTDQVLYGRSPRDCVKKAQSVLFRRDWRMKNWEDDRAGFITEGKQSDKQTTEAQNQAMLGSST